MPGHPCCCTSAKRERRIGVGKAITTARLSLAYGEALQRCELDHQLSIRFCTDVPVQTRARRRLEQALIQRWQPPFNKETRQRWATPFHADLEA